MKRKIEGAAVGVSWRAGGWEGAEGGQKEGRGVGGGWFTTKLRRGWPETRTGPNPVATPHHFLPSPLCFSISCARYLFHQACGQIFLSRRILPSAALATSNTQYASQSAASLVAVGYQDTCGIHVERAESRSGSSDDLSCTVSVTNVFCQAPSAGSTV